MASIFADWTSKAEAGRILGVDASSVPSVALAAGIAVRRIPGVPDRYSRADLERVVREAVQVGQKGGAA